MKAVPMGQPVHRVPAAGGFSSRASGTLALALVLALSGLSFLPSTAQAGIVGDSLYVQRWLGAGHPGPGLGTQTVTAGGASFPSGAVSILVGDDTVEIRHAGQVGYLSGFNGFVLTDLSGDFPAGYRLLSGSGAAVLSDDRWVTSGRTLSVSLGGLAFEPGDAFVLTLAPPTSMAPVPEPESWALLAAGVGTVGWFVRRRRATTAL